MSLLSVKNLSVQYGGITAVHGVSFHIDAGEVVSLIGSNGAGKSSILKAVSGLVPFRGEIVFTPENMPVSISAIPPDRIVRSGIVHVPEGRGIFGNLTVLENLKLATWQREGDTSADFENVFQVFPRLKERCAQEAGTLSGGEQQMLAVGRALMAKAKLMLLDEPSMGLAPRLVKEIFHVLREINRSGMTILLVEQNAKMALQLATRAYVLETGSITLEGTSSSLMENSQVVAAYLGNR